MGEASKPSEIPLRPSQQALGKKRTKIHIIAGLAVILAVSILLFGFFNNLFSRPQQTSSVLVINAPSAIKGKTCVIEAVLKDKDGNPIKKVDVDFQTYKGDAWWEIGFAMTNSSGISSISYTPLTAGVFQVRAIFMGTASYSQSSTVTSLDVAIDYGPLNSYVQQLENKGFQISQGTWEEPSEETQFDWADVAKQDSEWYKEFTDWFPEGFWTSTEGYVSFTDWTSFVNCTEQIRTEHQQESTSDPIIIYVDIERSVFWFLVKAPSISSHDVTVYWSV